MLVFLNLLLLGVVCHAAPQPQVIWPLLKLSPWIKLDVSSLAQTQWVWQGQTFEVTPEKLGLISPLGSTGQGPAILIPDPFLFFFYS